MRGLPYLALAAVAFVIAWAIAPERGPRDDVRRARAAHSSTGRTPTSRRDPTPGPARPMPSPQRGSTLRLTPWQRAVADRPDAGGTTRALVFDALMQHFREHGHPLACLIDEVPGDVVVTIEADLHVTADVITARRWRFGEITDGPALTDALVDCVASVLPDELVIARPSPNDVLLAGYEGPFALELAAALPTE